MIVRGAFALAEDDHRVTPLGPGDLVIVGAGVAGTIACVARSANTNADPAQGEGELLTAIHATLPEDGLDAVTVLRASEARREPAIAVLVELLRAALSDPSEGREHLSRSLVEPLLAHARFCVEAIRDGEGGAAPVDEQVKRALDLMRASPEQSFTVASLAKAVGLSRAAFARRFLLALGVPPLRYLADLRMDRAARLLVESDDALAAIAGQVGYASEFAFSRAFKRRMGEAPIVFRRRSRSEVGSFRMPTLRAAA
ncbi:Transcriptional regulator, AraC family protein [Minicystis rosea]|nr:Transcriptional regulator, AraC family protein [Minicystis rosea]